jgi:hypothetical protein
MWQIEMMLRCFFLRCFAYWNLKGEESYRSQVHLIGLYPVPFGAMQ